MVLADGAMMDDRKCKDIIWPPRPTFHNCICILQDLLLIAFLLDFESLEFWNESLKIFVSVVSGRSSYLLVQLDGNSSHENDGGNHEIEDVMCCDETPPESDAVISKSNLLNQEDGYIQKQFEAFLKQYKIEKKHFEKKEVGESEIFRVWTYMISSYRQWK